AALENRLTATEYVMEAEIVGYDPETASPVPFQQLSQRVKRKHDIEAVARDVPVRVYVFDLLYLEGESYIDRPLRDRVAALEGILDPDPQRIDRAAQCWTGATEQAVAFYEDMLAAGHEGSMIKNPDATYQPGSRVGYQLKVKPTMEPLDLVVTRAKWSEGRKSDFLGRPYLACRDADGAFREVGRMHTGFTDEDLVELTDRFEPLIQEVDGREVSLHPEVVLEVEYEEIQASSTYDSGYALRFPRFKRVRHDMGPGDVDSLARVKQLYAEQD
ncbi:MAG: ATP-dependent DNA ligase, partial [Haloplanus sp.]